MNIDLKSQFFKLAYEIERNLKTDYNKVQEIHGKEYKKQLSILKSNKLKWLILDIATHYLYHYGEMDTPIVYANKENIRVNFFIGKSSQIYAITIDLDKFLSRNCRIALVKKQIDSDWEIFVTELKLIYAN